MSIGKNSSIIKVVVPINVKDRIKYLSETLKVSISYFCLDAILDKVIAFKEV